MEASLEVLYDNFEKITFVLSECDEQLPVSDFDQVLQTIDRVIEWQYCVKDRPWSQ